jgi:hypothetical protein
VVFAEPTSSGAPASTPDVLVHIASINTRWATELCIRSMRATAGRPFDLVVGDCGSTDGSITMLRRFERDGWLDLEVAHGGRRHAEWLDGWLAACKARYCVFSDSDIEYLEAGWLDEMVRTAQETGAALVCEAISPEDPDYISPINGAELSLAARPTPWLMLVDTTKIELPIASFAFVPAEEGTTYDVGAKFLADLERRGLKAAEMPSGFQTRFHHYGGVSWMPTGFRSNKDQTPGDTPIGRLPASWRQARTIASQWKKEATIAAHLLRWRWRQRGPIHRH